MNRQLEIGFSIAFIGLLAVAFIQDAFAATMYKIGGVYLKMVVELHHPDGTTTNLSDNLSTTYPGYNFFNYEDKKQIQSLRFTWLLYDSNPDFMINESTNQAGAPEIRAGTAFTILGRSNYLTEGDRTIVKSTDGEYTVYRLYTVHYTAQQLSAKLGAPLSNGIHTLYMYPLDGLPASYRGDGINARFENDKLVLNIVDDRQGFSTPTTQPPVTAEPDPAIPGDIPVIDDEPIPADGDPVICTNDCNQMEATSLTLIAAIGAIGLFSAYSFTRIMKKSR